MMIFLLNMNSIAILSMILTKTPTWIFLITTILNQLAKNSMIFLSINPTKNIIYTTESIVFETIL